MQYPCSRAWAYFSLVFSMKYDSYVFDWFFLQFGYDQGHVTFDSIVPTETQLKTCSVMSGIITGPYFVSFFESPSAIEVGSIVAVLEIGAFSMSLYLHIIPTFFTRLFSSYVHCSRKDWRYRRSEMDLVWRCSCIHHWRTHSNIYGRRLDNDFGATR